MRELVKSFFGFSWAMTLFGAHAMTRALDPRSRRDGGGEELDAITRAARDELGEGLEALFAAGDRMQRRLVDAALGGWSGGSEAGHSEPAGMIVVGDDLAAGMGAFALESVAQRWSFPALVARGLGIDLRQPLFEPPGLGDVIGLPEGRPIVPELMQTTVLERLPERADLDNLAVPGFTLEDAFELRPRPPLVDRRSARRTLANFILGLPALELGEADGPTMVEYARRRRPALAVVAFGYRQALEAALGRRALPPAEQFAARLGGLLEELAGAERLVIGIPDPFDTAYYSGVDAGAALLKTTPEFLIRHWDLARGDYLTLPGLIDAGYQMMNREIDELPAGAVVRGAEAEATAAGVARLDREAQAAAEAAGAHFFDLRGLVRQLAEEGVEIGGSRYSADYLGGLYQLNGFFPGPTLNAVIATRILELLSERLGRPVRPLPLEQIAAGDPNTRARLAPGPPATSIFLEPHTAEGIPQLPPLPQVPQPIPIQTTYPDLQPDKIGCQPLVGVPAGGYDDPGFPDPGHSGIELPLRLPEGLEQTLDVNPEGSFFGDALRAVDCPDDQPILPGLPPFGLCGGVLFGGPVLTSAQLRGKIHVKFSPPDEHNRTRFEIRHPGGLDGDDTDLVAPKLFKMRSQFTRIQDIPELVSGGVLELDTGRVTDFHYNVRNWNSALATLIGVNPNLPPLALLFPGQPNAGSTWIGFEQRPDGRLDVTLVAHMFVPLGVEAGGEPIRFALPLGNPGLETASFLARGTSLHPRIRVTTRTTETDATSGPPPEVPFNTVQEYTAVSHNTTFGDDFGLEAPELGAGGAVGRDHLLGRLRVQFGPPSGATVPVLLSALPPGGLLGSQPRLPPFLPRGISRGLIGFDTVLHFPKQTYRQSGLASPDDPFNLCVGNVDLRTGRFLEPVLYRGYVVQQLFADLVRAEPCTPSDSFNYQGLARLERGPDGGTRLAFNGTCYLPYPAGFRFPAPDGGGSFVIGGDSRLDPFRRIRAAQSSNGFSGVLTGGGEDLTSASGRRFSYRYSIPVPGNGTPPEFEYHDHSTGASFRLRALSWLDCGYAGEPGETPERPDLVTFTGFGEWSPDPSGRWHQASVQVSAAPDAPYVGIQIDGGESSNVDVKPADIARTYA